MSRTRIKICGIRHVEDALVAVDAGADAIGLVFHQSSPRAVTLKQARDIASRLPAFVDPVGLFVDVELSRVQAIATEVGLRTVQLHGSESPEYASKLRPLKVIKAIGFTDSLAEEEAQTWCDAISNFAGILWDTPPAGKQASPGGSGQTFDWDLLRNRRLTECDNHPFGLFHMLAGGLNPSNVGDAIRTVEPYAVDVSSGVESRRGVKDADRIRAFCDAVREADKTVHGDDGAIPRLDRRVDNSQDRAAG